MNEALKTRLLIIRFSTGSHRGLNQPRNAVFAQALRTDGPTDGPTDRPSYRDARTHLKKTVEHHDIIPFLFAETAPCELLQKAYCPTAFKGYVHAPLQIRGRFSITFSIINNLLQVTPTFQLSTACRNF